MSNGKENVKWIKSVKISDGIDDDKRIKLLGSLIKKMANHGKRSRLIRITAISAIKNFGSHVEIDPVTKRKKIVKGVAPHDNVGEVQAIQRYVQSYHYVFDPKNVEYFQTPRRAILDKQNGIEGLDCDDLSILCASLLSSIGYETSVAICNPRGPGQPFTHAMCAVKLPKAGKGQLGDKTVVFPPRKWIALELTVPMEMGWKPPKADNFIFFKVE